MGNTFEPVKERKTSPNPSITHPEKPTFAPGKPPYVAPKKPDFHTRDRPTPTERRIDSNE
jgi:hypothetical protein